MSIDLIESTRLRERSYRGAIVSIAIHAGVITLAVFATASAGVVSVKVPADTVSIIYTPVANEPKGHAARPHPAVHPFRDPDRGVLDEPRIPFTSSIPDSLPSIPTSEQPIVDGGAFASHATGASSMTGSTGGSDGGEPLSGDRVEKPAVQRAGNPAPKYPSLLESTRVEGTVLAQFVVDTLGRVDMSTLEIVASSNDLFSAALEKALPRWRFHPAEAGGRKVKQIVRLPLKFVAPRP
jgi:periplasmic protein TonB